MLKQFTFAFFGGGGCSCKCCRVVKVDSRYIQNKDKTQTNIFYYAIVATQMKSTMAHHGLTLAFPSPLKSSASFCSILEDSGQYSAVTITLR